jgi:hypothetical protein
LDKKLLISCALLFLLGLVLLLWGVFSLKSGFTFSRYSHTIYESQNPVLFYAMVAPSLAAGGIMIGISLFLLISGLREKRVKTVSR